MPIRKINFTPKAIKLIRYADDIAKKSNFKAIHPIHLFLGALKFDCDVNNELKSIVSVDEELIESKLNSSVNEETCNEYLQIKDEDSSNINISLSSRDIILESKRVAELYEEHGQIFLSDGQIIKSVLNSEDEVTKKCLEELDKDLIISIISSPRDMIVDLNNEFSINDIEDISIRKVTVEDKKVVREFVLKNFYERWTNTIDYGLSMEDIPIYIALEGNKIIGFAGYNISKQRKGYFGPLGVLKAYRDRKVGQALVNACLIEMKKLGYEKCIIGNSGSIEFYEKACGAKVVPMIDKK